MVGISTDALSSHNVQFEHDIISLANTEDDIQQFLAKLVVENNENEMTALEFRKLSNFSATSNFPLKPSYFFSVLTLSKLQL